jgi:uncharacterized protein YgiM (DUF1202 family)
MILMTDLYPTRNSRVIIPLLFCLLALFATGCASKPSWKPVEERKVATPPPEPPPKVESQVLYVAADRLNLRACPGMDCPRITMLSRNQEVEKVGESQGWFQVRSRQDGTLGWVDARYLASTPVADNVVLPSETVQPKQTRSGETKSKMKTSTPVVEEEVEEAPPPKKRRRPAAEAAEPPEAPSTEPVQETPPPAPAAPSDSGKKKIRIM